MPEPDESLATEIVAELATRKRRPCRVCDDASALTRLVVQKSIRAGVTLHALAVRLASDPRLDAIALSTLQRHARAGHE